MRPHASFLISRRILLLNNLCACSCVHSILNTRVKVQMMSICARRKSIRSTPASSQSCRCQRLHRSNRRSETASSWLAAASIKQGMWLESHYLALLLPLKSVTNLMLTTEFIFRANRSSLPSRLEVHEDNVKIQRDSPTSINTRVLLRRISLFLPGFY
jgi:hypothetical protein